MEADADFFGGQVAQIGEGELHLVAVAEEVGGRDAGLAFQSLEAAEMFKGMAVIERTMKTTTVPIAQADKRPTARSAQLRTLGTTSPGLYSWSRSSSRATTAG